MKYRKKPVVIEAVQYIGDNIKELELFCEGNLTKKVCGNLAICTLEGVMSFGYGDYIIKGVAGECYPCKPDIFAKTYEIVEGE